MTWTTAALGEIAIIERNSISPANIKSGSRYVGLDHIESGGGSVRFGSVENGELASSKFQFGPNHILFGKLRPYLAKIVCPDFAGICSTDIIPIAPGQNVDKRYLLHFLRRPETIAWAAGRSAGVNLPRLSPKELASLEIPLPPLDEQRRIAAVLDKADALGRKRKHALDLLDGLTNSVLKGFNNQTTLGNSRWPTSALRELCTLVRGSSPRPQGDPRFFGGPIPRLMIADITRDGKYVSPSIDSLTEEGAKKSRAMKKGSVVMAVSGAVGLPAILTSDACIHDGFVGFRDLATSILPTFLYHVLLDNRSENQAQGTGAIWSNLTTDQVKAFRIPLVPVSIQQEFVNRLERVEQRSQLIRKSAAFSDLLFSSLQSRAFSGQL